MKPLGSFTFAAYAADFDRHITTSIRGYADLRNDCVGFSQYFVQDRTTVLDIGCSSGELIRAIRDRNQERHPTVKYVGLDIESKFRDQWAKRKAANVRFQKCDVRAYDGFENLSLVYSLYTLQFLPERDRLALVRKIYRGMNEGGALILAEKVMAKTATFHDMIRSLYYDFKRETFTADEVLNKEQSIRDQMHLWSEFKIFEMLRSAGFKSVHTQLFWRNHLFIGILAMKSAKYR